MPWYAAGPTILPCKMHANFDSSDTLIRGLILVFLQPQSWSFNSVVSSSVVATRLLAELGLGLGSRIGSG